MDFMEKRVKCLLFFVLIPRFINSDSVAVNESYSIYRSKINLMISASSGISFSLQAFFAFPSMVTFWTDSEAYPVGVVPPSHRPGFASSCILSRIRSAIVSRFTHFLLLRFASLYDI